MKLPLVGWSLVPGGTPRTMSSARNRSTSNMFIDKGFKASRDTSYPVFKAGVPKRWLPNTTHPARGTF